MEGVCLSVCLGQDDGRETTLLCGTSSLPLCMRSMNDVCISNASEPTMNYNVSTHIVTYIPCAAACRPVSGVVLTLYGERGRLNSLRELILSV